MSRGLVDIGAEGILLAGAGRAILLQIADPAVGHGVAEHSDFASRPLDRLRGTMSYVYAVVYGTDRQLATVRRAVNRAHAPVRRKAEGDVPGYSAFDVHAQLWVAATLYDTAVTVYERIHGPLDEVSANRVYREYARIGTELQVPAKLWPADRSAFTEYWKERLATLAPDDVARSVSRQLMHPDAGPPWLRAGMPLVRNLTAGLLPSSLRDGFGLEWSPRRFEWDMRVLAAVYPRLPRAVRHWPKNHYLALLEGADARA